MALSITWLGLAKGRGLNTFGTSLQAGPQFVRHTLTQNRAQENGERQKREKQQHETPESFGFGAQEPAVAEMDAQQHGEHQKGGQDQHVA